MQVHQRRVHICYNLSCDTSYNMCVEWGREKQLVNHGCRVSWVNFCRWDIITSSRVLPLLFLLFKVQLVCVVSLDKNAWWYIAQTPTRLFLFRFASLEVVYKVSRFSLVSIVPQCLNHVVEGLEQAHEAWTLGITFFFLVITSKAEWFCWGVK